jgi:hypothetical protein
MKHLLRGTSIFIILAFCASACEPDTGTLNLPYRFDVPVLLGTHINSYDLRDVRFTLDLAVFKGDNSVNEVPYYTDLPDSSFKFTDYSVSDGTLIHHTIEKVQYTDTSAFNTFSTLVLIDQSAFPENFDTTDSYNERFEAYNAFYKNLNGQGKVAFAYFGRESNEHNVVTYINQDFSDKWDESTVLSLLDLTHRQSGSSGLYDALERAIYFISAKGLKNPSITLFVRNKDDGLSDINLDNLIYLANQSKVRINVIWLIHLTANVDIDALRRLTNETGGFEVYMGSIYQMTSVFLKLPDLLRVSTSFYRISVKMTATGPSWFSDIYKTGFKLYYYTSQFYQWNYIPIYLAKPKT